MDKQSQKDEFENLKKVLDRKTKEFEIIKQISSQINKTLDINLIASAMLNAMDEFFGFKYSMILLVDEKMQKLNVLATHGYEIKGIGASVKLGVGVIGIVAKKKKMMRMANLGMQRSYMKAIKSQISPEEKNKLGNDVELPGLKNAESQVAIPMLFNNELIGVLSVESEKVNIFNNSDELLIGILANQTANALQNAKLYQLEQKRKLELNNAYFELEKLNNTLEKKVDERTKELVDLSQKLAKYFSPQVYQSIFSGKLDVKIQTKRKPLTVFFSDLEGFTELTERLEPEVLTEILTQYLTEMSNIAIKWGGTIDKFIGDALLVFFGDPNSNGNKEDAIACVSMAIEMTIRLALEIAMQKIKDKILGDQLDKEEKKANAMKTQTTEMKKQAVLSFFTGGSGSMGSFAQGGAVSKGKPILVGERGAEVFVPNSTGQIVQHARGQGGGGVNVNFTINTIDSRGFAEALQENRGTITGIINNALAEKGRSELI